MHCSSIATGRNRLAQCANTPQPPIFEPQHAFKFVAAEPINPFVDVHRDIGVRIFKSAEFRHRRSTELTDFVNVRAPLQKRFITSQGRRLGGHRVTEQQTNHKHCKHSQQAPS